MKALLGLERGLARLLARSRLRAERGRAASRWAVTHIVCYANHSCLRPIHLGWHAICFMVAVLPRMGHMGCLRAAGGRIWMP